jgi:hypothetical protein
VQRWPVPRLILTPRSILAARAQALQSRDELLDRAFSGVHSILMDDGLDSETVHHYAWHDRYCIGKTKRIVRIEVVAESILKQQLMPKFKERRECRIPADK